jgi:Outer membrane protein beta-barrel domain
MRTPGIFIIVFLGFNTPAFSQNILFGFTAGAGISGIAKTHNIGVAFEQRKVVPDFFAGIAANLIISNDFSFRPELYFEKKGWISNYNNLMINLRDDQPYFEIGDSILNSDKVKLNYLKLPLIFSFSLPQVVDGKLSIEFGPYIAYAISGSYSSSYGNNTGSSVYNFKTNIADTDSRTGVKFSHYDYGLNFRMGYELSFGIMIHAAYELGLHDVVNNTLIAGPPATKFKSFLLRFSYMLH